MKKLLLLSFAYLFVFSSCSSDDDSSSGSTIDARIIGTWLLESSLYGSEEEVGETDKDYYKFEINGLVYNYYQDTDPQFPDCFVDVNSFTFNGTTLSTNIYNFTVEFDGTDKFTIQYMDGDVVILETFVRISESDIPEGLSTPVQDSDLLGQWNLDSINVGVDDQPSEDQTDVCNVNTTLVINSDGTFAYNGFEFVGESCTTDNDSGTWETYTDCSSLIIDSNEDQPEGIEYYIHENSLTLYINEFENGKEQQTKLTFTRNVE